MVLILLRLTTAAASAAHMKTHEKDETMTDTPPIKIFVSKGENRITFKMKAVYYPELLTPETMKLL